MKYYDKELISRAHEIDGLTNWTWVSRDTGAWQGPVEDWKTSHKEKYTKFLRNRNTAVCAGGNLGLYPKLLSQIFSTVYTFEPDALNFHCLVNNCQSDNIIKINAALGETHKMISLDRPCNDNLGMHRVNEIKPGIIPVLRLDDFVFEGLDFLQLDVEGFEIQVLRGGIENIKKHKPVISCENGSDQILTFLKPMGYDVVEISVSDTIYGALI